MFQTECMISCYFSICVTSFVTLFEVQWLNVIEHCLFVQTLKVNMYLCML